MAKRINYSLSLLALLACFCVQAQDSIRVGLFHNTKIQSMFIGVQTGGYEVRGFSYPITLQPGDLLKLSRQGKKVVGEFQGQVYGPVETRLLVQPFVEESSLKILPITPKKTERWYEGSIELVVNSGRLLPVNIIHIESYLPGVVEAETGGSQTKEFYKVQGTISRTYAIRNFKRHKLEGFSVCDQVHCQVYHGVSRSNTDIHAAIKETVGKVIVNEDLQLITAAFHSNCGGETVNSEHVWSAPVQSLRSVSDSFCLDQPHYNWKFKLSTREWEKYVLDRSAIPDGDTSKIFQFQQPSRSTHFLDFNEGIPLKNIRRDWRLKSTYFDLEQGSEFVYFLGRGFGHGVGMCQEGAMIMARNLKKYHEIIHHYYTQTYIVDRKWLPVLRSK